MRPELAVFFAGHEVGEVDETARVPVDEIGTGEGLAKERVVYPEMMAMSVPGRNPRNAVIPPTSNENRCNQDP